jgi:hypothetical protein
VPNAPVGVPSRSRSTRRCYSTCWRSRIRPT